MKKRLLLFTLSLCTICFSYNSYAQNLLSESFDDLNTFPPTGWDNSVYQQGSSSFGTPYWDQGSNNFPYPSPSPHSGAGMAWYNSELDFPGDYAELATPSMTFSPQSGGYILLSFWCYNDQLSSGQEIDVYANTQATSASGQLLTTVHPYSGSVTGWVKYSVPIPSTITGTQYIIFKGVSVDFFGPDLLLDDVSVDNVPACSGVPPVGTLTPDSVCSGSTFTLSASDTVMAAGVFYNWQTSTDGINWSTIQGAIDPTYTTSITSPTYFRMIATCSNSGLSDTSVADLVNLNPYYVCYCNDSSQYSYYDANIGNVMVSAYGSGTVVLNNGVAFPTLGNTSATNNYSNFSNLTPAVLALDSVYTFTITQTQYSSWWTCCSPVNIYIDLNHDGVFQPNERVFDQIIGNNSSSPSVTDTFRIPANTQVGLSGMRVILGTYQSDPLDPCTPNSSGEVEDYLVNISYDLCNGAVSAGVASATDTTLCPGMGYSFTLSDFTHERSQAGVQWEWEQSPDNGTTWGPVANTLNSDTVTQIYNLPVWYRMRTTCTISNTNNYSNIVKVSSDPGYACYCYSEAIGGRQFDSSDIGAFGMGNYMFNATNQMNNSHVNNPSATRGHTDNTPAIMNFDEDSTYHTFVYHILKSPTHGDAKVTMFIDYNNNHTYDIPEERVWTAYTTADSFFVTTDITIPHNVIPNVPTGMRVIINNNVSPNVPSDDACGSYTSGETEDYVVILHDSSTVNVTQLQSGQNLLMYPNPTNGMVKVFFTTSKPVKEMIMRISNITGQQIMTKEYTNIESQFSTDLDLTNQPRGMYFVEFITDGVRTVRKLTLE